MIKATGIVRSVDSLGRVVIPKEIRRTHQIPEGTPLKMFVDSGGEIILKKYEPTCIFCGNAEDVRTILGKKICGCCHATLRK